MFGRMFAGFRDFALKGNIVDLAVAVVIGGALTALVTAFTAAFITPLVNRLLEAIGMSATGTVTIAGAAFGIGAFLTAVVTFFITLAAVYFVIVAPMAKIKERQAKEPAPVDETPTADVALLTEIRDLLKSRNGDIS